MNINTNEEQAKQHTQIWDNLDKAETIKRPKIIGNKKKKKKVKHNNIHEYHKAHSLTKRGL